MTQTPAGGPYPGRARRGTNSLSPAKSHPTSKSSAAAFEIARRKALQIVEAVRRRDEEVCIRGKAIDEVVERYRWLIASLGVARATPGGDAIAALARRGYLLGPRFSLSPPASRINSIDSPWIVHFGIGLPTRSCHRWSTIEHDALSIDIDALPPVQIVSVHVTIRVKVELRKEGIELG
ncbi:hypothetical protein [Rhodobacteraceae bacterium DSL-40]|uniref:hypothetical protein n=1 Tax=Amaricoccus sp. B4 TaxID=3368557 RepID=UPI000DAB9B33